MHIHQDLAARVARLDETARHDGLRALATEIDAIRAVADRHGIGPVSAVARAVERAIARGESGATVRGWIGLLGEAVQGGRTDAASGSVLLAAGAMRLGG